MLILICDLFGAQQDLAFVK